LNENPTLIDELNVRTPNTPATITIAEMDVDDVPILFRVCIFSSFIISYFYFVAFI
jgi:hypothetical protein